jgi:hypothetical protein
MRALSRLVVLTDAGQTCDREAADAFNETPVIGLGAVC